MTGQTMSSQILKDSFKMYGDPIYVSPSDCDHLQRLYFLRYPGVLAWHKKLKNQLIERGSLTSASGHKRIFFGRKKDQAGRVNHDTFKEMCAEEPQANTAYATNLALLAMWNDPENQRPGGRLVCTPVHTVHDALIFHFPKTEVPWVKTKIKQWFNNPLTIAGHTLTIPFEGGYGPSWGNLKEGEL